MDEAGDFSNEDLIPHQEVVVTLSQRGYIKCVPAETYRRQHRGGKGVRGQTTREGDVIHDHLVADTHDFLLFFTNTGRVYRKKVYDLHKDNSRVSRGVPLVQAMAIRPDESVQAILDVSSFDSGEDILFATRMGEIKRMSLGRPGQHPLQRNQDHGPGARRPARLRTTRLGIGRRNHGQPAGHVCPLHCCARSGEDLASAGGVRGMRLKDDDIVVAMDVVEKDCALLVISQRGYGKPSPMDHYRQQSRGGSGLQTFRITSKSGPVATARVVKEGEDIMIISQKGQVTRTNLNELRELSRRTQGVSIVSLPDGDVVVSITSMEPKARHVRDTRPRAAAGRDASFIVDTEAISTNGHEAISENGHLPGEDLEEEG